MNHNESEKMYHKSVLIKEVVQYLAPQPGKVYVDATFGGGGHTQAILDSEPLCKVIALDWDMQAIEQNAAPLCEKYGDRLRVIWGNFALIHRILKKEKIESIDGILADFGTSQFQIFEKSGFSFRKDSPLDMRMSKAHYKTTAADILNTYSEQKLAHILFEYGEERLSKRIARAIVEMRKKRPFKTTQQLADLVEEIVGTPKGRKKFIHPATKTFQALRIEVNHELDNIKGFLASALKLVNPEGRIVCISFHSLEDRIVKTVFRESNVEILTPKPVTASLEEIELNPSARSAKLRAARICPFDR
ncbi:MAG: 16S rRNA (cytosine(1402)-N(4))-methyltransferase RsmH [bacterium]